MSTRRTSTRAARSRLPQSQSFQGQPSIQRFTRSSKPGTTSSLLLDGKDGPVKTLPTSATTSCLLTTSPSKKRKLNEIDNSQNNKEVAVQYSSKKSVEDTPSKTIKFSSLSLSTPRSARTSIRKRHSCSAATSDNSSVDHTTTEESTPRTSESPDAVPSPAYKEHPAVFDEFVGLHSCFLKTIGLHFAHKGTTAPADLKEFLPRVEKLWKKRKVVVEDLQRIIQLWDDADCPGLRFRIANYGLGKVCFERVSGPTGTFNENELHTRFVQLLENKWRERVNSKVDEEENDGSDFVEKLALAPIHESLTPFNALRKGQQRLQDLKGGVIKIKTAMMKAKPGEGEAKVRDPTADRRKGLLERIKSKELLQSKLGPPPTKEQLLRRSAAQRAEDVARVLALLRPPHVMKNGNAAIQKKPFKWEALVQTIQDSLRNPIPADEVGACLEILGHEDVAADWIEIITIGKLKSVVLMSGFDVSPKEIGVKASKMKF